MDHHPIWKENIISTTGSKHSFNLSRCHFTDIWGSNSTTFQIARKRKIINQKTKYMSYATSLWSSISAMLYKPLTVIPLLVFSLTDRQIESIHKIIHPSVIVAKGFNRNWPIPLRYGKHKYCGLDILNIFFVSYINFSKVNKFHTSTSIISLIP